MRPGDGVTGGLELNEGVVDAKLGEMEVVLAEVEVDGDGDGSEVKTVGSEGSAEESELVDIGLSLEGELTILELEIEVGLECSGPAEVNPAGGGEAGQCGDVEIFGLEVDVDPGEFATGEKSFGVGEGCFEVSGSGSGGAVHLHGERCAIVHSCAESP